MDKLKRQEMDSTLKDSSLSYSTAQQWVFEFKKDARPLKTNLFPNTPLRWRTLEIIEKILKIVLEDLRLKLTENDETVKECIENIYVIFWVCARFIPRLKNSVGNIF
ncbi:hypothetical protein CEXT_390521 [Caerostris extrusa]|uniref:Transposase n=1 Tax=Caerostris extrusa TaxID=172846 RepID=A0AAV4YC97_CAEEX|nr:hypothetical protein CEXT_390521 [Caerostris extrusa]